jgi:hypothetical protein
MEERHLHFGIVQALFLYLLLFWVIHPIVKFAFARFYVPGASELAHTA